MRTNPVKLALARGDLAIGTMIQEFTVPAIPRIAAAAGADFLMFDMEHTGLTTEKLGMLCAVASGVGVVPLVRAPSVDYPLLSQLLDVGALGVMIPNVETADQARAVVRAAKYAPLGQRGTAFGIAHDDYLPGNSAETMRVANENVLLIAQIESQLGVENVDEIAQVDGIDVLWIGHNDLTASMGIPGHFDDPRYLAAVTRVAAACRTHGRVGGFRPDSTDHAVGLIEQGFHCLAYLSDVAIYRNALRDGVAALRTAFDASPEGPPTG